VSPPDLSGAALSPWMTNHNSLFQPQHYTWGLSLFSLPFQPTSDFPTLTIGGPLHSHPFSSSHCMAHHCHLPPLASSSLSRMFFPSPSQVGLFYLISSGLCSSVSFLRKSQLACSALGHSHSQTVYIPCLLSTYINTSCILFNFCFSQMNFRLHKGKIWGLLLSLLWSQHLQQCWSVTGT
jgi:hypothetical protein